MYGSKDGAIAGWNRRAQGEILVDKGIKPGSLPIDVDATLEALHTQYQIRADAIVARHTADAPDMRQLGMIRDAHLNMIPILKALKEATKRELSEFPVLREVRVSMNNILGIVMMAENLNKKFGFGTLSELRTKLVHQNLVHALAKIEKTLTK